jgi:hypothetical protein
MDNRDRDIKKLNWSIVIISFILVVAVILFLMITF